MKYYFLAKDQRGLYQALTECRSRITAEFEEQRTSANQSSETWHDNYTFEESRRQVKMAEEELKMLETIERQHELVEPKALPETVAVGVLVTIADTNTNQERRLAISSYHIYDKQHGLEIPHNAPLASQLLGAKIGEVRSVALPNGDTIEYQIKQLTTW